tara:strand:- start:229 stop:753 length:525 start_codon:yes stop_codon:yes gene_type:complete
MINEKFVELLDNFDGEEKNCRRVFMISWADTDEQVGIDYCMPFMSEEDVSVVIRSIQPSGSLYFVSDVGTEEEPYHLSFSLPKTVESLINFQRCGFLKTDLLSAFYIFDDSLSWYILVDEGLMIAMKTHIFDKFLKEYGGANLLLSRMKHELEDSSGPAADLRANIIREFEALI